MKKGQTSIYNGIQNVLFPMEFLNITQGDNEGTHKGTYATDTSGKDSGIDSLYAPVDMTLMAFDSTENGNAIWFQSNDMVRCANGTIDYVTMLFIHDNDISDVLNKKNYKQGQKFSDEGTSGYATGNHSHMEFAIGKYTRMYNENCYGVYHLPNNRPIEEVCFIDGTTIKQGIAAWKYVKDIIISTCPFMSKGTVIALYDHIRVRNAPKINVNTETSDWYDIGMKLNYQAIVTNDGWYWAEYTAFNGETHYCALCKLDGSNKYWKQV